MSTRNRGQFFRSTDDRSPEGRRDGGRHDGGRSDGGHRGDSGEPGDGEGGPQRVGQRSWVWFMLVVLFAAMAYHYMQFAQSKDVVMTDYSSFVRLLDPSQDAEDGTPQYQSIVTVPAFLETPTG